MNAIIDSCWQQAVSSAPTGRIAEALRAALHEPSARERVPDTLPCYPEFTEIQEPQETFPDLCGCFVSIAPAAGFVNLEKQRTSLQELFQCGMNLMDAMLLQRMVAYHATNSDFLMFMSWSSVGNMQENLQTGDLSRPPALIRNPAFGPAGPASVGLRYDKHAYSLAVFQIPRIGMLLVLAPKGAVAVSESFEDRMVRLSDATALHMHENSQDHCGNCKKQSEKLKRCKNCVMARYCSVECQREHWPQHRRHCREYCRVKDKGSAASASGETISQA